MRKIFYVIGTAAALLNACAQDSAEGYPTATSSSALNTVQDCIAETKACVAAAKSVDEGKPCGDKLRACLGPLLPNGGAVPSADAGVPMVPPVPSADAGAGVPGIPGLPGFPGLPGGPTVPAFDGGVPSLPAFDGGVPSLPALDAGVPSVPTGDKTQSGVKDCLTKLNSCLGGSTDPMMCATDARTCLKTAIAP